MKDGDNRNRNSMARARPELFRAIDSEKTNTTAEEVVARLRDMIQGGDLVSGDRLPPERDLAKMLGVSRPTLRAGIRSLTAVGILQSRQGAGTFVAEAQDSPTLDTSALRLLSALHGFTSDEMFEARLALEMSIAALAAERATSEDIAHLAEEIAGMYASLDRPEQYLVHDMQFHQTVAAASGNRILTALMNMVATILFDYRSKTVKRATDLKQSAEQHHNIYRAIREHDPEAARQAMSIHLIETQKAQRLEIENEGSQRSTTGSEVSK
ncbi:MAG TPA: FadR/GntR family transcriptional regulator [Pyrinomonadaceae bacterium]|nr:FadR/GntR family transcriptional regulator [Pyrinomonadaceae bacterium]